MKADRQIGILSVLLQREKYAPGGESSRRVEPYYLIFKWSSWYVWGWCLERKDFRLFKLNHLKGLEKTETGFEPRPVPMPDLSSERIFPANIRIKALFKPDAKWRLVEEFGPQCFEEQEDGRLAVLLQRKETKKKETGKRWRLIIRKSIKNFIFPGNSPRLWRSPR